MLETIDDIKLPAKVHEVLRTYFHAMNSELPDLLSSFYVIGSLSLGAFIEGRSDIDFVAVTKRPLSEPEILQLQRIHRMLKKQCKSAGLDGKYTVEEHLFGFGETAYLSPYFNDGRLIGFELFDRGSIDAYRLKKYGLVIIGRPIESYQLPENWTYLKEKTLDNVNTYWTAWKERCSIKTSLEFPASLLSKSFIEWGVLGVTRLYFTLNEEDIISKAGAGEYALHHVPVKHHRILKEALRIRNGSQVAYYKSVFARRKEMLEYMTFVINECNKLHQTRR
ncbi:aminoglycoside adenylyltransferase domain-containing protein [Fictibacillus iocasae]|uniref:Aminoglycoside adenylyltransferase domain-containing protein n=1 Tax=Fictibacillus iocasae TaxID=2715437 RepID=A0ABW2NIV8_9BACL